MVLCFTKYKRHCPRFDRARTTDAGSIDGALVVADAEEAPDAGDFEPWTSEPTNLNQLMDRYNLESKLTGRESGTSLYIVNATSRDGQKRDCAEGQEFKLFLATCLSGQHSNFNQKFKRYFLLPHSDDSNLRWFRIFTVYVRLPTSRRRLERMSSSSHMAPANSSHQKALTSFVDRSEKVGSL